MMRHQHPLNLCERHQARRLGLARLRRHRLVIVIHCAGEPGLSATMEYIAAAMDREVRRFAVAPLPALASSPAPAVAGGGTHAS